MLVRFTIAVVAGLIVGACGGEPVSPPSPMPAVQQPRCAGATWSADHETGDLSQWYVDSGGGEFNSGAATSSVSQQVARSGRYSVKATINTPNPSETSGVRLFRWKEGRVHPEACYGAWYYFPQHYTAPQWWNVFQFKSRDGMGANDAFWQLEVGNRPGGALFVYLTWWGPPVDGPRPGEFGPQTFHQSLKDLPVGEWTHLEVYLRQASAFDGQIIVWQDGVELFNLNHVRTRYPASNGANEWSINNYSEIISPSPTTIYIDDAAITTAGLGP